MIEALTGLFIHVTVFFFLFFCFVCFCFFFVFFFLSLFIPFVIVIVIVVFLPFGVIGMLLFEPRHDKTNKMTVHPV